MEEDEELKFRPGKGPVKLTWTAKLLIVAVAAAAGVYFFPVAKYMPEQKTEEPLFASAPPVDGRLLLDEQYFYTVKKALKSANRSIKVAMYVFRISSGDNREADPAFQLAQVLREKARQGVEVEVLLAAGSEKQKSLTLDNKETANYLRDAGVRAKVTKKIGKIHAKVVLIDGEKLLISNHNWAWAPLKYNAEAAVYLKGPGIKKTAVKPIRAAFAKVFGWEDENSET